MVHRHGHGGHESSVVPPVAQRWYYVVSEGCLVLSDETKHAKEPGSHVETDVRSVGNVADVQEETGSDERERSEKGARERG